ncbi:hypothetical protein ACHAWF_005585 [Thalassiosira exigua]
MAASSTMALDHSIHDLDGSSRGSGPDGNLLFFAEDDSMCAGNHGGPSHDFTLEEESKEDFFRDGQPPFIDQRVINGQISVSGIGSGSSNNSSNSKIAEDSGAAWVLLNLPPPPPHGTHSVAPIGGMRRVSSCYFSIASNFSAGDYQNAVDGCASSYHSPGSPYYGSHHDALSFEGRDAADFLLHDVLMNVFSFLDARSLASFSETGRRPNFECFYFLELQLQRAVLVGDGHGRCSLRRDRFDKVVEEGNEEGTIDGEEVVKEGDDDSLSRRNASEEEGEGGIADSPIKDENNQESDAVHSFDGSIAGTGVISRLASLDSAKAREIVQSYLDSNASIQSMPLSHSLKYLRQVLLRQGGGRVVSPFPHPPPIPDQVAKNARNMAMFVAFLGAAYVRTQQGADMPAIPDPGEVLTEDNVEALKALMLKVGLAGGVFKAGQTMKEKVAEQQQHQGAVRGDAVDALDSSASTGDVTGRAQRQSSQRSSSIGSLEDLTHKLPNPSAIASRLYNAFSSHSVPTTPSLAAGGDGGTDGSSSEEQCDRQIASSRMRRQHRSKRSHKTLTPDSHGEFVDSGDSSHEEEKTEVVEGATGENKGEVPILTPEEIARAMDHPFSPNPYDHQPISALSDHASVGMDNYKNPSTRDAVASEATSFFSFIANQPHDAASCGNVSTGCIGAYARAVRTAAAEVTRLVKAERRSNFEALSPDEQHELGMRFLDACTNDARLPVVKDILQRQRKMDVDRFFVGPDETETCALHAAAFNGAEVRHSALCAIKILDEFSNYYGHEMAVSRRYCSFCAGE